MSEKDLSMVPSGFRSRGLRAGFLVALFACSVLSGCRQTKDARATPAKTAREALEVALNAWQNGQSSGKIENASPPVQAVDSIWSKGRKLQSYEILSEDTEADGVRWFSVRLSLQKPESTETVRYVVKGRSPVWIYREEDHQRSQSWQGMK